jgi:hypothetical protein
VLFEDRGEALKKGVWVIIRGALIGGSVVEVGEAHVLIVSGVEDYKAEVFIGWFDHNVPIIAQVAEGGVK